MRERRADGLFALFVALLLACTAHGLFEDQAGSFDWHRQQLGPVVGVALHGTKPRAFMASSQNVVGSLNLRDGSIAWRRLLDEPIDSMSLLDRASGSLVLSVSGGGARLRAWDQAEGGLRWESVLGPSPAHSISVGMQGEECQIAVATPAALKVFSCTTGSTDISRKLPLFQAADVIHALHSAEEVAVYGYKSGSQELLVASLANDEASPVVDRAMQSDMALSGVSAVGRAGFAALSADFSSLCTFGAGAASVSCTPLSSLGLGSASGSSGLRLIATSKGFVLHSEALGAALFAFPSPSEPPTLLKLLPTAVAVSTPLDSTHGEIIAALESDAAGSVTTRVLSTASGEELYSDTVQNARGTTSMTVPETPVTRVTAAYLGTYRKKDKSDGFRTVVVWEDDQVALLQQGTSVWSRSEALGAVRAAMFVDLPVAPSAATAAGKGAAAEKQGTCDAKEAAAGTCSAAPVAHVPQRAFDWDHFIRTQLLNVKVQFKINTPEEAEELMRLRAETSDRTLPVRDINGFRKLILTLSGSGTLSALHNGDGHVEWTRFYPRAAGVPDQLLPWRFYHDLNHAPQALLLHLGGGSSSAAAYGSIVDAHTGSEVQRVALKGPVQKVLPVYHHHMVDGQAEQSLYLLVGEQAAGGGGPMVQLLPDTPESRSWFSRNYQSVYFWLEHAETNTLTGYGFDKAAAAALAADGSTSALQVWQLAPSEPILGVATRDMRQAVQTSVKVLGDRSIKYKYLNPNTLLVVTGSLPAGSTSAPALRAARQASDDDSDEPAPPELTLMLVDSATGRVMYSQVQQNALGPVRLLFTENLAVAEFWDAAARKMAMVSMEIHDATPREFSVLDYLFNPNSTKPISSFEHAPLEVTTQAFWTRVPSRFLAVTSTQQGITSKQLVMATVTDQLYALDLKFLDPRRPKKAKLTQQEVEERLTPYSEYLPLMPQLFVSYDKQVLGLSNVVIEPSRLESTCLLFASGVDLFYTRLAPARKYDSLEDDFPFALLVGALLGLAVGAVVMHRITKKSMLSQKWT